MEYHLFLNQSGTDRKSLHQYLQSVLPLPEYYGNNLDALNDYLSSIGEKTIIHIYNNETFLTTQKNYGSAFFEVLNKSSMINNNLIIIYHD